MGFWFQRPRSLFSTSESSIVGEDHKGSDSRRPKLTVMS